MPARQDRTHVCIFGKPCWCGAEIDGQTNCSQRPAGWPMTSEALGVHPAQRQEAYEESRRLGVPTDYDAAGRAVLTDPGHRKRLMHALGFEDRGKKVITIGKNSRGLRERIG